MLVNVLIVLIFASFNLTIVTIDEIEEFGYYEDFEYSLDQNLSSPHKNSSSGKVLLA